MLWFVFFVVLLALVFDFINGFHDAANSIATIVSTGVLKPLTAVLWAAFFNFIAFLFFHLSVANTVGAGLVDPNIVTPFLIFAALIAAIVWNLFTWYFGWPSSSSHALIGGLVGAGLAKGGIQALHFSMLTKILIAIILSPLLGLLLSYIAMFIIKKLTINENQNTLKKWFKYFQLFSAAMLSLSHGGNDAQKMMGVIAALLFSVGFLGSTFYVPFWVVVLCNLIIALGTLAGGWRIVHTLGKKITFLTPINGSVAETSAAALLFAATELGIPVSTTHTITGAITGVGIPHVQWKILKQITLAWLFTLPTTAILAAAIILAKQSLIII